MRPRCFYLGVVMVGLALICTSPASASGPQVIKGGQFYTLCIRDGGFLYAWGANTFGQLGLTSTTSAYRPTRVGVAADWVAVSAGHEHSLGIRADGSLWAWGRNQCGQLGLGYASSVNVTVPIRVGDATGWTAVTAAWDYSLGLKGDGSLWTWGRNHYGQLGLGYASLENVTVPARVGEDADWEALAASIDNSLALKADGTLWAWGSNISGQLGLGDTTKRLNPTRVGEASNWVAVSMGWYHSLGVRADGSLWGWGSNVLDQLGLGHVELAILTPTPVGAERDWADVAAGGWHSLARKTDGSLWAWGYNFDGELGQGCSSAAVNVPTRVGCASTWTAIAAGGYHSLGFQGNGSLWGWGTNYNGQLGLGGPPKQDDKINWLTPTAIWSRPLPAIPLLLLAD